MASITYEDRFAEVEREDAWDADSGRRHAPAGGDPLAKGLGLFSIALGVAQIAAPRKMSRFIGIEDSRRNRDTMLAIGLRELASGFGILTRSEPAGWLQARAGGDVMDLALLGRAYRADRREGDRLAMAIAAVAGVLALDVVAARRLRSAEERRSVSGGRRREQGRLHVTRSITVGRPRDEVYGFWRNLENLPRFMEHLKAVEMLGEGRSRWRAKAPAGLSVEWTAETVTDRPDLIAWRSLPDSTVPNSGQVRFVDAPGNRGTEVHLELHYDPPAGRLGALVAKLFGEEPGQQVTDDLSRFKQVMEVGEVVHSDASIHRRMHSAQPPEEARRLGDDSDPAILDARSREGTARSSNVDRDSTTARPRATEPV
ncbi:MAG TPA: SRPBCC family protein [Gemmatimonadales bacterium]|nr:SRPBCC family protein [Gemmatimonadales bacterium]